MGNQLPKQILENWKEKRQVSTDLNSRDSLVNRLSTSKAARERFVSSHVDKGYAFQIREMREHVDLSQSKLGSLVGMNQNAIHRLESPDYGKATITSLKRIAAAFDVALIVRFVPFSQLINWVSGTPFVDKGLSTESLAVPNFEEEKKIGMFGGQFERTRVTTVATANLPIFAMTFPLGETATVLVHGSKGGSSNCANVSAGVVVQSFSSAAGSGYTNVTI